MPAAVLEVELGDVLFMSAPIADVGVYFANEGVLREADMRTLPTGGEATAEQEVAHTVAWMYHPKPSVAIDVSPVEPGETEDCGGVQLPRSACLASQCPALPPAV